MLDTYRQSVNYLKYNECSTSALIFMSKIKFYLIPVYLPTKFGIVLISNIINYETPKIL